MYIFQQGLDIKFLRSFKRTRASDDRFLIKV